MLTQKPILPKFHKYKNYLKNIDSKRIYSNYGPLYFKTQKFLEKYLRLKNNSVVLTSSGDSALYACLKYLKNKNKKKKYILVPSFSFPSDIHSIINAGFEPFFLDVNYEDWSLSQHEIIKYSNKYKKKIAGILIVSPFGYPLDIDSLIKLKIKTKTEIIYDAADTIFNLKNLKNINFFLTVSFHPTKNIPGNESGMIICKKSMEENFKSYLNFGQDKKRNVNIFGFNGKISEYDCAILLASLKSIAKIKNKIKNINHYIVKKISNSSIIIQNNIGKYWYSNKIFFYCKSKNRIDIEKVFLKNKIRLFRPWTGKAMHLHKFFKNYKRGNLKNTLFLTNKILGIPLNNDIDKLNLDKIIKILNGLKKF